MDALTPEFITTVARNVHPEAVVDPTSIAYLQHLLTPYAQAVEQAESVESVYAWLDLALPGELAKHARSEVAKAVDKAGEVDDTEKLKAARRAVIEYLEAEILELAGNASWDMLDMNILPWDIKKAITKDEELEKMLQQNDGTDKLVVTVRIGANEYSHSLTEDFVAGILLYYNVAVQPITLFLYGVPLTTDYAVSRHNENAAREGNEPAPYIVSVGGEDVAFWTPDFLQGAATAAQWLKEDYHTRVTNLRTFDDDGNEVPLTF